MNVIIPHIFILSFELYIKINGEGSQYTIESHNHDQFFSDGQRRINYVIAYNLLEEEEENTSRREERFVFLTNLKEEKGLELEPDFREREDLKNFEVCCNFLHGSSSALSKY